MTAKIPAIPPMPEQQEHARFLKKSVDMKAAKEAARNGWGTHDLWAHFGIPYDIAREIVWNAEAERLARKQ